MERSLKLVADRSAPAVARRALEAFLTTVDPAIADDVALLTTELVTNSIRHSEMNPEAHIWLKVWCEDDRVRVQVEDPGTGRAFGPKPSSLLDTGGRGLLLVSELSDRWGVRRERQTCVWFELDLQNRRAG